VRIETLPVDPGQFAVLVDELRFKYHKWDAYVGGTLRVLPDALMITPAEHNDAVNCCVRIHDALGRAAARVLLEPRWLDRLGIPPAALEIMRAEIPPTHGIVRYDLIPTASGWMVPEFNEDAPGGFNECIAGKDLYAPLLGAAFVPGDFAKSFLDAIPPGNRAGLVYATGYAEDLQHVLILSELLELRGIETVLAAPSHLTCGPFGRPRLLGKTVDWIFRFFPGEWYGYLENIRDWRRTAAIIPIINPLSRLVRQSKALYALWREVPVLDPHDTDLLNRYTPHTEFFRQDRAPLYREQRENWVLKKLYGRMGDSVAIGRMCTPEVWDKCLAEAAKAPRAWIAQHAFSPLPVLNSMRRLFPALGVYLVDGAFAGYYSRVDEIGFTTHEAYYVVTAVETV